MERLGELQQIWIDLSDGTTASFTGPAQISKEQLEKGVYGVRIAISDPQQLPEGVYYEVLKDTIRELSDGKLKDHE